MAKRLTPIPFLVASVFAAIATATMAEGPSILLPPPLVFTLNTHFAPTKLPKAQRAGVDLRVDNKIGMADGSRPPALEEFVLEIDRSAAIDARGLPVCHPQPLEHDDTAGAELNCKPATVGEGKIELDVAFPEQSPFPLSSRVIAFNGGVAGGKTTIFLHAYLAAPVSATMVIRVEVAKVRKGRYGLQAVAKVPKIAGGYGSVTSLSLKLGREFTYRDRQKSYLSLKCVDGKTLIKDTATFSDGTSVSGTTLRVCTAER